MWVYLSCQVQCFISSFTFILPSSSHLWIFPGPPLLLCCWWDRSCLQDNFSCLGCGDNCQIARIIINYVCTNIHGAHPRGCDQSLDRLCWVTNIYVFCVWPIHIHWNLCQHILFWLPHEMTRLQTWRMNTCHTCHHQWEMGPVTSWLVMLPAARGFRLVSASWNIVIASDCDLVLSWALCPGPGRDSWKMAKLYQVAWWEEPDCRVPLSLAVSCYSCLWGEKCSYKTISSQLEQTHRRPARNQQQTEWQDRASALSFSALNCQARDNQMGSLSYRADW